MLLHTLAVVVPEFQLEQIIRGIDERSQMSDADVLSYLADNGVFNLGLGDVVDLLVVRRGLSREDAEAAVTAHPDFAGLARITGQ